MNVKLPRQTQVINGREKEVMADYGHRENMFSVHIYIYGESCGYTSHVTSCSVTEEGEVRNIIKIQSQKIKR